MGKFDYSNFLFTTVVCKLNNRYPDVYCWCFWYTVFRWVIRSECLSFLKSCALCAGEWIWIGFCSSQNLINYCVILCFVHEIYFACFSINCFQTLRFSFFFSFSLYISFTFSLLISICFRISRCCCCIWINEFKRKSIMANNNHYSVWYLIPSFAFLSSIRTLAKTNMLSDTFKHRYSLFSNGRERKKTHAHTNTNTLKL